MNPRHQKNLPFIVYDGMFLNFYSKSGELIGGNLFVRVHDEVDIPPTALIKCGVNICGSEDEMRKIISKWNEDNP